MSNLKAQIHNLNVKSKKRHTFFLDDVHGGLSRRLYVNLSDAGDAEIVGRVRGNGENQYNVAVTVEHIAPDTKANVQVRAVLKGGAKLNFAGKVKINKNAGGSDSFLELKVLLIGESCSVKAVPALEIENNNVKCSHKVSVSGPNEEEIFYLMSRGLNKAVTEGLIGRGFLA